MTRLQDGQSGAWFWQIQEIFLLSKLSRLALGPTHSIQWICVVLSLVVNRVGCELRHSSLSTAKIKNGQSYTSTPCVYLPGMDRDNFTFYRVV